MKKQKVNVATVFEMALARIEKCWTNNPHGDGCCAYTAICQARPDDMAFDEPLKVFIEANKIPPVNYPYSEMRAVDESIWKWNDARSRTKRQVIAAFTKAIEYAEAAGL